MTSIENNTVRLGRDVEMAIGLEPQWAFCPKRFFGLIVSREALNSQQQWHRPPQLGSGLYAQPSRLVQASIGGDLHLIPTLKTIETLIRVMVNGHLFQANSRFAILRHLEMLSMQITPDLQGKLRRITTIEIGNSRHSLCIIRRLQHDAGWQSFDGLVPRQIRLSAAEGRQFGISVNVIGKQITSLEAAAPKITMATGKLILGFDYPQSYQKCRIGDPSPASGEPAPMVTSWQLDISRSGTRPIFDLSGTAPSAIAGGLLTASGQIRFVINDDAPPSWTSIGNEFAFQIAAFSALGDILIIDLPICHITSSRIITQTADDVVSQEISFELRRGNGTSLFRFLFGDSNADN